MFPSLSKLLKYATMRQEQLEMQENIDKHLQILQKHCPSTVADIYRLEREINRKNSQIAYQYSIIYNLGAIDKMLTQVTNFYDNISQISQPHAKHQTPQRQCHSLRAFSQSYATNLHSGKLNLDNPYEHNGPIKPESSDNKI